MLKIIKDINWKHLLKLDQNDVIGLDIGSSSVRIVQLRKNSGAFTMTAANLIEIASAGSADSEQATVDAIRRCMRTAGVSTDKAVCSLSGPEVAVRNFRFPPLQSEEMDGAIRLEAAQVCPFNIEDSVMDYQIIPNGEDCVKGTFVAATKNVINRKVRLVKKAGLNCVLMDVDGLALLNCFAEKPGRTEREIVSTAILDVGGSFTTLAIMGDNKMPFVRNLPYAGRDIMKKIADENHVSVEIVHDELFGRRCGVSVPQDKLHASMTRACEQLVTDVIETLRFHTAQEKSSAIERILVCGGFAPAQGFVDAFESGVGIKVTLWNLFDDVPSEAGRSFPDEIRNKGPAMAVATGLAMRSI